MPTVKASEPRLPQPTEAQFTSQILKLANVYGWRSAHFRPGMNRRGQWSTAVQGDGAGFPDLILVSVDSLCQAPTMIVAELKVGRNKVTPEQKAWLEAFECCGVPAYTWRPGDWKEIQDVLGRRVTDSHPTGRGGCDMSKLRQASDDLPVDAAWLATVLPREGMMGHNISLPPLFSGLRVTLFIDILPDECLLAFSTGTESEAEYMPVASWPPTTTRSRVLALLAALAPQTAPEDGR